MRSIDRSRRLDPASLSQICLLLLPVFCATLLCLRVIPLADLGMQLGLGGLIAANGTYLHEPYSASHLGEPLIPNAWLAECLYYWLKQIGGWKLLRVVDGALWLSAFFIVAVPARLRKERPLALVASLLGPFALALPTAEIRPQSFAALAFGLTLLLVRTPSWRSLGLCIPVLVLWQNLHPSVSLAGLVIGAITGTRWILFLSSGKPAPLVLSLMLAASVGAIFATPAGPAILTLTKHNAEASLAIGATEWLPLWSDHNRNLLWPVLLSAAIWPTVAWRRKVPIEEVVPAALMLIASLLVARFILFYAIAIVPVLARMQLGQELAKPSRSGLGLAAAFAAVLIAFLLPVRLAPELPFAVVDKLKAISGTIFCDPAFGGVIVLRVPGARLSHDGRFFLYSAAEINLLRQTRSDSKSLVEIERIYQPKAFVLAKFQSNALIHELGAREAGWRLAFENVHSVVYVARDDGR